MPLHPEVATPEAIDDFGETVFDGLKNLTEAERLRKWADEHNENADELSAEWQGEL